MKKKLILVGDSAFAMVAYEYFTYDSSYEVVAFAVEEKYHTQKALLGLPVVPVERIEKAYPPEKYSFHVAVTYIQLNRVRARLINLMKNKGYSTARYIHSGIAVWPSVYIGDHCFIFDNNVIQPYASIGDNCVLWSGNHIGHHASVGDSCFISSHVVLSGYSKVGANSFIGVNSAVTDTVEIGSDCIVGAGCIISKNLPCNTVTQPASNKKIEGARKIMRLEE